MPDPIHVSVRPSHPAQQDLFLGADDCASSRASASSSSTTSSPPARASRTGGAGAHRRGTVTGRAAILAEGDALSRKDITFLAPLPVFNPDGSVKG